MESIKKLHKNVSDKMRNSIKRTPNVSKRLSLFSHDISSELCPSLYRLENDISIETNSIFSSYESKYDGDRAFNTVTSYSDEDNEAASVKTATVDVEDTSVGIKYLPGQVTHKLAKQPFNFNLMVLGPPGCGKSTLINSLFRTKIMVKEKHPDISISFNAGDYVRRRRMLLTEKKVQLNLCVLDVPDFGRLIDNFGVWLQISSFIEDQLLFYDMMRFDVTVERKLRESFDTRVHLVIYLLSPMGETLSPLDICTLKALQGRANIVPVISKADSLTQEELMSLKKSVRKQLKDNELVTYTFKCHQDSSDEMKQMWSLYNKRFPLAIVASDQLIIDKHGIQRRVRQYAHGTVDVDDIGFYDFKILQQLMIKYGLVDLVAETDYIYESFISGGTVEKNSSSQ